MSKSGTKKCGHYSGIGGQAVLEGVMMKNREEYAVSVRRPDGGIETKKEKYEGVWGGKKITKLPFIRGVFSFLDSMVLGMQTLTWSAGFYEDEEAEETKADAALDKITKGNAEKLLMGLTVAFSVVLAVAIFIALPFGISLLFQNFVRNASLLAILEGLVRLVIFLIYVAAIASMKDIRRVYQYHGAEHKCINCVEHGRELTVKNVMKSSRFHKRCGTSFLLFVVLISILLFMFIRVGNPFLRLGLRILLIPVVAGISYEVLRLAGRTDNALINLISRPGLWLQRLTTREPDESMVEVAIASVEAVFDWKAYLKEEFGYEFDEEAGSRSSDAVSQDAAADGALAECVGEKTGTAAEHGGDNIGTVMAGSPSCRTRKYTGPAEKRWKRRESERQSWTPDCFLRRSATPQGTICWCTETGKLQKSRRSSTAGGLPGAPLMSLFSISPACRSSWDWNFWSMRMC